jgi:hypothetical protein
MNVVGDKINAPFVSPHPHPNETLHFYYFLSSCTRYYEKRRKRLKGLKEEEELEEAAQVVEFDDLIGKYHII